MKEVVDNAMIADLEARLGDIVAENLTLKASVKPEIQVDTSKVEELDKKVKTLLKKRQKYKETLSKKKAEVEELIRLLDGARQET